MIATYSGNLTAYMIVRKLKLPVDSLEELAVNPEYQALFQKGTVIIALFKGRMMIYS